LKLTRRPAAAPLLTRALPLPLAPPAIAIAGVLGFLSALRGSADAGSSNARWLVGASGFLRAAAVEYRGVAGSER
jgi:hypothetical protein